MTQSELPVARLVGQGLQAGKLPSSSLCRRLPSIAIRVKSRVDLTHLASEQEQPARGNAPQRKDRTFEWCRRSDPLPGSRTAGLVGAQRGRPGIASGPANRANANRDTRRAEASRREDDNSVTNTEDSSTPQEAAVTLERRGHVLLIGLNRPRSATPSTSR